MRPFVTAAGGAAATAATHKLLPLYPSHTRFVFCFNYAFDISAMATGNRVAVAKKTENLCYEFN